VRGFPARLLVVVVAAALVGPVGALRADAASTEDLDRLRGERETLEDQVGALTEELDQVQLRIADATELRDRLEAEVAALEARATEASDALRARALHLWTSSSSGPLEVLFAADGPGIAMERSRLLDSMGHSERGTIEAAQAARAGADQRRAVLDEVLADLRVDEARLAELRAAVDAAFRSAWTREREIASRAARQRRVSRDRQRGVYACPIAAPFHFRDTWGAPRSGGRKHKGVDIFGPMGQEVYAITSGVIARHTNSRLGGLGLYLAGDDGNTYYYAHLRSVLPGYGPGRRVEAGEWIAENGDSGNARGGVPHIHFEVRPGGGGPISPYPFAAAACL
jgi:peptidoglycan LD-endopeptidase LytH